MKKRKSTLPVILGLLICCGSITSLFSQQSLFSFEQYLNGKGDTLRYRQLVPDYGPAKKFPLVVFLHGSGERGNDNEAQLKWGVMNFASDENMKQYPAIVIAPQCPAGISWSNFSGGDNRELLLQPAAAKPMELLVELVKKAAKTLPIDTSRIYITGLSMGGFGTFDAIARHPNLFAAAVPVCGGGDVSKAPTISHIPIWIFTGAEDGAVNPGFSFEMVGALTKAGAHPGFTQYPEVGHFSWIGAYSDPMMMAWLFRQHK
ncbi:MAG: prolyl oligopeptidase family serine peptidase [Saprospiraceae bacterium]|nr:prolyl oligopeptidase family serine peptidase [Saprospiraceae bacterium]MDZ4703977.1 prolyl oligopeptidase family serine peptidase [Saprospiraceae bacterium]